MNQQVIGEVPTGDICGEGAVWSTEEQGVYWPDINRFLIHCYLSEFGTVRSWHFDEPVVALALSSAKDRMLVALGFTADLVVAGHRQPH